MNSDIHDAEIKLVARVDGSMTEPVMLHTAFTKIDLQDTFGLMTALTHFQRNLLDQDVEEGDEEDYVASAVCAVGYVGGGTFAGRFSLNFRNRGLVITGDTCTIDDEQNIIVHGVAFFQWNGEKFLHLEIPPEKETDGIGFALSSEDTARMRALMRVWGEEFVHEEHEGGESLRFKSAFSDVKKRYTKVLTRTLVRNVDDWEDDIEDALCDISLVWGLNLRFG